MKNTIFCCPYPPQDNDSLILIDGAQISPEDKSARDEAIKILDLIHLQAKARYGNRADLENRSDSVFRMGRSTFFVKGYLENENNDNGMPFVFYVKNARNHKALKAILEQTLSSQNYNLDNDTNEKFNSFEDKRIYTSFWQLILLCLFIIFILWAIFFW